MYMLFYDLPWQLHICMSMCEGEILCWARLDVLTNLNVGGMKQNANKKTWAMKMSSFFWARYILKKMNSCNYSKPGIL